MFKTLGIRVHRYRELLQPEDYVEAEVARTLSPVDLDGHRWQGLAVGEHAWAGALRFLARATLEGEPHGEGVVRRYLEAAILSACATRRLLRQQNFAGAVVNHGIYVPQGITGEVARAEGVRVATWSASYRQRCFIFSHDDTYHHTLMNEPVAKWETIDWNDHLDARTEHRTGSGCTIGRRSIPVVSRKRSGRISRGPASACSPTSCGTRRSTIRPMLFRACWIGFSGRSGTLPSDRISS
jgi:hypothetical protein